MSILDTRSENYIFWSEIGSGFGEQSHAPQPKILRSPSPPPPRDLSVVTRKAFPSFVSHAAQAELHWFKVGQTIIIPECFFFPSKMESETEQGATPGGGTPKKIG